jgi:uncharacterized protein (DUF1501 family)
MPISRRRFLAGAGAVAGAHVLGPIAARAGIAAGKTVAAPSAATRHRLVVIFQSGGNDGLNMVVPRGDVAGAPRYSVYRKVRPSIAYKPEETLALDRAADTAHQLGLNPKLTKIHDLYRQGRVAVVQGVDYPNHSYSHFASGDIWQSGAPDAPSSGWLGRHLDRAGIGEAELRAVGIGYQLPLIFRGSTRQGIEIVDVPSTHFYDGVEAVAAARHNAFAEFGTHSGDEQLRHLAGRLSQSTVEIVRRLQNAKVPAVTGVPLTDALATARVLLEQDLGVECVFIEQPGYDTHTTQRLGQEALLLQLDTAIDGFWKALSPAVASRTMVMTWSEFGRRIGENGAGASAGTDHGAAAPLFLIGPPNGGGLVPGIHGDHPKMGTTTLPADNLEMTTDVRSVYQAVLTSWLGDPDPAYAKKHTALPGLFR